MREWRHTGLEFLDGEFPRLAVPADCFVDSSIGSTADEADDFVAIYDSNFALVSNVRSDTPISWVWVQVSDSP